MLYIFFLVVLRISIIKSCIFSYLFSFSLACHLPTCVAYTKTKQQQQHDRPRTHTHKSRGSVTWIETVFTHRKRRREMSAELDGLLISHAGWNNIFRILFKFYFAGPFVIIKKCVSQNYLFGELALKISKRNWRRGNCLMVSHIC